jgi:hypothetical protein
MARVERYEPPRAQSRLRCEPKERYKMPATYRADHVGSLLRPPELLQARQDHFDGKITAEQLPRSNPGWMIARPPLSCGETTVLLIAKILS